MIAGFTDDSEIYIWDEPLNYLDIQSREQIENMIIKYQPTMLFIEHDEVFINKIATKVIELDDGKIWKILKIIWIILKKLTFIFFYDILKSVTRKKCFSCMDNYA